MDRELRRIGASSAGGPPLGRKAQQEGECYENVPEIIGEEHAINFGNFQQGDIRPVQKNMAVAYTLTHENASYISPHYSSFDFEPGCQMKVSDGQGEQSYVMTGLGRNNQGKELEGFWGQHITGDTMVSVVTCAKINPVKGGKFKVDKYAAGFADGQDQGTCKAICGDNDFKWAKCYNESEPTIYDKARAVARLIINGTTACTGWLVGDEGHLMTAQHCIGNQVKANNTDYEFMAEGATCSTKCRPAMECPGTVEATSGEVIQANSKFDFTLIYLTPNNTNLAEKYGYLQMRSSGAEVGERIYIPQHPLAHGKRISVESDIDGGNCTVLSINQTPCTGGPGDVGYYCDTKGGLSGSPVIGYSDHAVMALHHCANCPNRGVRIQRIIAKLENQDNVPNNATV